MPVRGVFSFLANNKILGERRKIYQSQNGPRRRVPGKIGLREYVVC